MEYSKLLTSAELKKKAVIEIGLSEHIEEAKLDQKCKRWLFITRVIKKGEIYL